MTPSDPQIDQLVIGLAWPYREWGGAQTHLATLVAPLSDRHRIVAFVPRPISPALRSQLAESGVQVVEAGPATLSGTTRTLRARVGRRVTDVRAHRHLRRAIRTHTPKPDVFHVDFPLWNSTAAVHALLRLGPVVQTFHTPLPPPARNLRDVLLRAKFRSVVARKGYRLQAATRVAAASLRPWVGDGPDIDVIGTVDLDSVTAARGLSVDAVRDELGIPPGRFVIGTLGQLIARKGLDVLLEAARCLLDDGVDIHVLLGGEGEAREDLESLAVRHRLGERLTILSPSDLGTSHAEHLRVLLALDTLVMPSREEGLPLTLLEGLALPRPAVVTDVGAIGDVFADGEHLLLVPPDDADSIVDAIHRLRADEDLRTGLCRAAEIRVLAEFDPTRASQRYETVLVDLLRRCGGHPRS